MSRLNLSSHFSRVAAVITVIAAIATVGCSNEETAPRDPTQNEAQTPPSSNEEAAPIETLRGELNTGTNKPGRPAVTPTSYCNALAPVASGTPVKVRISDEVAPALDQADVPNGTYVFMHGDLFTDRPRDNFTMPSSTLIISDRAAFQEVISDASGNTVRTVGVLGSRAGGNVKLSCVFPEAARDDASTDVVSYSKDADELTIERPFEGGMLRRVYHRQ